MAYSAARAAIDPSLDSLRKIKDREFTTNWSNHDLYNKQRSEEEQHKILNVLHENRGEETRTFEEYKIAVKGNNKFFNKLLAIRNKKRLQSKSKLSDKPKATEAPKVQKRKRIPSFIEDQPMTSRSARILEEKEIISRREEERRKQPKKKVKIYKISQL